MKDSDLKALASKDMPFGFLKQFNEEVKKEYDARDEIMNAQGAALAEQVAKAEAEKMRMTNIQDEAGRMKRAQYVQGSIEKRQGLDIETIKRAREILNAADVPKESRFVGGIIQELINQSWEQLEEVVLACLAAGVPASQIEVTEPHPVYERDNWHVKAGLRFISDYRCVRNEDIYQ